MNLQLIAALFAAGAVSFIAWSLFRVQVSVSASGQSRLEKFSGGQSASLSDRVGQWIVKSGRVDVRTWASHLDWAQLGGYDEGITAASLLGKCLLWGAGGLVLAALFRAPIYWLVPLVTMAFPYMQVRSKAALVRRRVGRSVPEVAALVAAELAAGNPPDKAVERAAELPSELGKLLSRAIASSRSSGKPLFTRKPVKGTLVETLLGAGLSELNAFASQLDLVAAKGVGGADLMSDIAKSLSREYHEQAQRAAERMESDLVIPSAIFFFLPFTAAIMLPLFVALMRNL